MACSLIALETALAIVRMPPDAGLPWWAAASPFLSFTRTEEETSLVCEEDRVPFGITAERDYRALRVEGTLPFHLTGVLASLVTPLTNAGVPVFVVSTYDTDYLLVSTTSLGNAVDALRQAGHAVNE